MNTIIIQDLTVKTHIGVTDDERRKGQKLSVSIEMTPKTEYSGERDELEETIDYSSVRKTVALFFRQSSFRLVEKAALECARNIKTHYPVKTVTVLVKKFPYRDTQYVGCSVTL